MKAKGSYVLVLKPLIVEERRGGLLIPPSSNDDFFEATLLDQGMHEAEEWGFEAGERVLVRNHGGKIKIGKIKGKGDVYVVDGDDILCSVEDERDEAILIA